MQILKAMFAYILGSLIIVIFALICLSSGRYALPIEDIIQVLCGYGDETQNNVVFYFRLPRILVAIIVGAGLSVAGGAFQSLFRNPLATPDILGVTSGASFGAVLGLLLGLSMDYISIAGFIFGILSLALVVCIGYNKNTPYQTTTMILSGIIVGALFQSLIGIVKYIADPQDTLPTITYWLLGSLDVALESYVIFNLIGIVFGIVIVFILRWKLNLLMLEDDEAKSLGVNLTLLRAYIIISSTMIVACSISMCGVIGWVGLLVPHIARLLIGNENSKLIPLSMFIGALFLMLIDTLSRTLSSEQIPISILTSLVGAPFFIYILRKNQRG
ncbi:FecCD family ABC transporter permease [Helicobacter cinaedi]|uniref:FecCD family ABC transporter permease n=1 Tax=Helicobacter cinaedi TaxID=213 RepID=UPI000D7CA358|nr:iron ABC transporter permease [Helicobacter cinaedi]BBB19069.1 vitamin B12 ABC transporter, permease component BtuC [Helicobacter cinaedi]